MASNSPYKAGTKRLKKGWKYPRGGGKPVRVSSSRKSGTKKKSSAKRKTYNKSLWGKTVRAVKKAVA